jgi:hypothetical protein
MKPYLNDVNMQNRGTGSEENPHTITQYTSSGVECSKCGATHWLDIFQQTLNSHQYMSNILNLFFNNLRAKERHIGYFQ